MVFQGKIGRIKYSEVVTKPTNYEELVTYFKANGQEMLSYCVVSNSPVCWISTDYDLNF